MEAIWNRLDCKVALRPLIGHGLDVIKMDGMRNFMEIQDINLKYFNTFLEKILIEYFPGIVITLLMDFR